MKEAKPPLQNMVSWRVERERLKLNTDMVSKMDGRIGDTWSVDQSKEKNVIQTCVLGQLASLL
jgi:hypothetical protein